MKHKLIIISTLLILIANTTFGMYKQFNDRSMWYYNSPTPSAMLLISGNGNVGIGTSSPRDKLEVGAEGSILVSAVDTQYYTQLGSSYLYGNRAPGTASGLNVGVQPTSGTGFTAGGGYIDFLTYPSGGSFASRMRIDKSGNVGIGTTTPGTKLDVSGIVRSTSVSSSSLGLHEAFSDNGQSVLQMGLFGSAKSGTTFGVANANLAFLYTTTYTTSQPNGLVIGTNSDVPIVFGTNGLESMRIKTGNVGIGTTNPMAKLDVGGKVTVASDGVIHWGAAADYGTLTYDTGVAIIGGLPGKALSFRTNNSSTDRLYVDINGNVGIGTSAPLFNLQVAGYGLATSQLWGASSWSQSGLVAFTSGYVNDGIISSYAFHTDSSAVGSYLRLDAGAAVTFTGVAINSGLGSASQSQWNVQYSDNASTWYTAYVGIDLTRNLGGGWTQVTWRLDNVTPAHRYWQLYKTNVATGGGYVQEVQFFSAVPEPNLVRADANGNVGIGTTAPTYKLQVNGTAANTTGVWVNLSDVRLKNAIRPIEGALETINKLRGVTFQWKDPAKGLGLQRGFIAQEVEPIIPEWVITQPDGYKALEKTGVEALLVEAIKELKARNDAEIASKNADIKAQQEQIYELKTAYDTQLKSLNQEITEIKKLLSK